MLNMDDRKVRDGKGRKDDDKGRKRGYEPFSTDDREAYSQQPSGPKRTFGRG